MTGNLLEPVCGQLPEELTQKIVSAGRVRIERIVSRGHTSPPGFWYDQQQREWVAVLAGRARLRFADDDRMLEMGPGDHVLIEAHRRHRVEWTDPQQDTVWLAVFF